MKIQVFSQRDRNEENWAKMHGGELFKQQCHVFKRSELGTVV